MDAAAAAPHDPPSPLHHTPNHSVLVLASVNTCTTGASISDRIHASGRTGLKSGDTHMRADGTDAGHRVGARSAAGGAVPEEGESKLVAWDGLVLAVVLDAHESMDGAADWAAGALWCWSI